MHYAFSVQDLARLIWSIFVKEIFQTFQIIVDYYFSTIISNIQLQGPKQEQDVGLRKVLKV